MVIIDTPSVLSFYDQWKLDRIRNTRHATSEERGFPVPRTGNYGMRKSRNGHGVSAGSRVLSHWYRDETWESKGQTRRMVRRIETRMWQGEWVEEQNQGDAFTVSDWFYTEGNQWDDWYYYENYDPTVDAPYYGVPYEDDDQWGYQRCHRSECIACDELEEFYR